MAKMTLLSPLGYGRDKVMHAALTQSIRM